MKATETAAAKAKEKAKAAKEREKEKARRAAAKAKAKKTASVAQMKTGFFPVYAELPKNGKPGRTNLKPFYNKGGVYVIEETLNKSKAKAIVYVGSSYSKKGSKPNLAKTILRHFQTWNDPGDPYQDQGGVTFVDKLKSRTYKVKIWVMTNPKRIERAEKVLIKKYGNRAKDKRYADRYKLQNTITYNDFEFEEDEETFYGSLNEIPSTSYDESWQEPA